MENEKNENMEKKKQRTANGLIESKMIKKDSTFRIPTKFFRSSIESDTGDDRLIYVEGDEDVLAFSADMTMEEFGKWSIERCAQDKQSEDFGNWLEIFTNGDNDLAISLLKKELTKRTAKKKVQKFCRLIVKDNIVYYLDLDDMQIDKITFGRANVAKTLYIFFLRQIERASKDNTVTKCLSQVEIAENREYLDELQKIYEEVSDKKGSIKSWFVNSTQTNDFTNALSSIRKAFEKVFFIPHIKVYKKCYSIEIMGQDSYGNPRYGIGLNVNDFDLGEYSVGTDENDKIVEVDLGDLGCTGEHNGHAFVDLGLPSGTLWATSNVGASRLDERGGYFAWGETEPKKNYEWKNYRYGTDWNNITKYNRDDKLTALEASDDAAAANWGGGWRMPTEADMDELMSNCSVNRRKLNGVVGLFFTGSNGNSIFLPEAGYRAGKNFSNVKFSVEIPGAYYWLSSLGKGMDCNAMILECDGQDYCSTYHTERCDGLSVRAVCVGRKR